MPANISDPSVIQLQEMFKGALETGLGVNRDAMGADDDIALYLYDRNPGVLHEGKVSGIERVANDDSFNAVVEKVPQTVSLDSGIKLVVNGQQ